MSQEVLEIVKKMQLKDIETQLVLQCAPLLAGLKISNLLIIPDDAEGEFRAAIDNMDISYFVLYKKNNRITILLYKRNGLSNYLTDNKVESFMDKVGYVDKDLDRVLIRFKMRYIIYMEENKDFPHEMGILLGYPVEDIEGFICNGGKNFLCAGYWKVYENPKEKERLFARFERAKETMIRLISGGASLIDIMRIYGEC